MNPLTQSKNATILPVLFAVTLACFALSPQARATCQEGCLTNQNTVLGDDALIGVTTGTENTALGFDALYSTTTGTRNTAIGAYALFSTIGGYNTAIGYNALFSNTSGEGNMASGDYALYSNTTGTDNTASGSSSLYSNTTGGNNTASGTAALFNNTTGEANTAIGDMALFNNTTGGGNTATGQDALLYNTIGGNNTATGGAALFGNTSGNDNTATGVEALELNTTGANNTASGVSALLSNTTGNDNTATGVNALYSNTTGNRNLANGIAALMNNTTGSGNIALGNGAGENLTIGDHNIDIGNRGVEAEANTIRIGRVGTQTATFIAGISGATIPIGVAVIVDDSGHLGTTTSSARFKDKIEPMDKASEAILELKPVTFRYKHDLDPEGIPQFGLVAEDVEKVNPDLVARDEQGKPYTVRYEAVNAMLLNEFLKAHRKIDEQERRAQQQDSAIAELRSRVQALTMALKEQATQIEKVSAELELSKATPQKVVRSQ